MSPVLKKSQAPKAEPLDLSRQLPLEPEEIRYAELETKREGLRRRLREIDAALCGVPAKNENQSQIVKEPGTNFKLKVDPDRLNRRPPSDYAPMLATDAELKAIDRTNKARELAGLPVDSQPRLAKSELQREKAEVQQELELVKRAIELHATPLKAERKLRSRRVAEALFAEHRSASRRVFDLWDELREAVKAVRAIEGKFGLNRADMSAPIESVAVDYAVPPQQVSLVEAERVRVASYLAP